ncbi:hypothetical protein ACPPVT_06445 [Angustibacter sp. McL0619]|uniref:hypothetical protein n=1 Tax=Angustibacter sp. McL0619 TaxID=3415676 RepID=UPI003CF3195D
MSDPRGALDEAARRGTQTAEHGFRTRWLRVGLVELLLGVVLVLAALFLRGALHPPGPVHVVGTSVTTPSAPSSTRPSPSAPPSSTAARSRTTTTRPRPSTPATQPTLPGSTSAGPTAPAQRVTPSADQIKPDSGPAGTLVDIGGRQLDTVVAVLFGKFDTAVLPGRSARVIQVMAPNGNGPGTKVPITLETKAGRVATKLTFSYAPSAVTPS